MKNANAAEQLKELDKRLGVGVGATKERNRLHKLIGTDTQKLNIKKPKKEGSSKNQNLKGKKSKEEKEEKYHI